jgi:hypothetical protein
LQREPQKITFGDMREMGVRGVLVYCADYHCSIAWALKRRSLAGRSAPVRYRAAVCLQGPRQA